MKLYSIHTREVAKVTQSAAHSSHTFLGFPLDGFSLFQSALMALASAFFIFFLTTCIAIFSLLVWNGLLHHTVNYADSYLYVGFPAGVLVLLIAAPFFGTLWVRAKLRG